MARYLYREWREQDERFLALMKQAEHMEGCQYLAATVVRIGWGDEYRPPESSKADVPEIEAAPEAISVPSSFDEMFGDGADNQIDITWDQEAQGLHFWVKNVKGPTIRDFRLAVTDVLWHSVTQHEFVESPDIHRNGPMPRVDLNGDSQLFHDAPVRLAFLHLETACLTFGAGTQQQSIRREGVWRASVELAYGDQIKSRSLCFYWKPDTVPSPCNCPA